MDRFNTKEDLEQTPLMIAKDIIYSDATLDEKVKQIETAIVEFNNVGLSDVRLSLPSDEEIENNFPLDLPNISTDGVIYNDGVRFGIKWIKQYLSNEV